MRLGDGDLLGLGVAGKVDDLEPVTQRWRDPRHLVRCRDEQHRGEVERQLDECVAEAVVLRRVEHLEQDRGRRGAELVDLVEHVAAHPSPLAQDRAGLAPAQIVELPSTHPSPLAQDRAGLRVPPGPVVAAQVVLDSCLAKVLFDQCGQPPPHSGCRMQAATRANHQRPRRASWAVLRQRGLADSAPWLIVEARVVGVERRAVDALERRHLRSFPRHGYHAAASPAVGVALLRLSQGRPDAPRSGCRDEPESRGYLDTAAHTAS